MGTARAVPAKSRHATAQLWELSAGLYLQAIIGHRWADACGASQDLGNDDS